MVNLILEERIKHDCLEAKLAEQDRSYFRRKVWSGIAGGAFWAGGTALTSYRDAGFGYYVESVIGGVALYSFLTHRFFGVSNMIGFFHPKNIIESVPLVFRVITGKTTPEDPNFFKKHVDISERISTLYTRLCETINMDIKDSHYGVNNLIEIFEYSKRKDNRTLSTKLCDRISSFMIFDSPIQRLKGTTSFGLVREAAILAVSHNDKSCEKAFDRALRLAKTQDERLTTLCAKGSFLETRGMLEESREAFRQSANELSLDDSSLSEINGGLKTPVKTHNSKLLGNIFVFKYGDKKDLESMFEKESFIQEIAGKDKKCFETPVSVDLESNPPLVVMRRAGNFTLKDYIDNEINDQSYSLIEKSLDTVLLLHLKSRDRIEDAIRLFGSVDDYSVLKRKFLDKISPDKKDSCEVLVNNIRYLADQSKNGLVCLRHDDLHPGNIVVNKMGDICIIDNADAKVGSPYADPVTLIDNHVCMGILEDLNREALFMRYVENVADSGAVSSTEESLRDMHVNGILRNLQLFGSSARFADGYESEKTKKHYAERFFYHAGKLESVYSGSGLSRIADCKSAFEEVLA
ncbi:MAG: phosphotransferase [Nanoarchaeota archaeon]|nr:phosphotransferase [Nanoarchaeota archaeon]